MVQYKRVEIPYGEKTVSFSVPKTIFKGIYSPHQVTPVADVAKEIRQALSNPIGTTTLTELARGAKRIVIVADDNTRPTPADIILPEVLDAINAAGVDDAAVQLLIALGTHRKMTAQEIEIKYGRVRIDGEMVLYSKWYQNGSINELISSPYNKLIKLVDGKEVKPTTEDAVVWTKIAGWIGADELIREVR